MKVLDHFDYEVCVSHLERHPKGALLLTFVNDTELSITDLDARKPGSSVITATRFPDKDVKFRAEHVAYVMLLPRDPRQDWREGSTEVSVSTRQRRPAKTKSPGVQNEHANAA